MEAATPGEIRVAKVEWNTSVCTAVQRRSGAEVHLKPPFWTLSPGKGAEHPRFSLFQTSPINQMCGLG